MLGPRHRSLHIGMPGPVSIGLDLRLPVFRKIIERANLFQKISHISRPLDSHSNQTLRTSWLRYGLNCLHDISSTMCMHMCIDTYIHTNIHTYIDTYLRAYIHVYVSFDRRVSFHIDMYPLIPCKLTPAGSWEEAFLNAVGVLRHEGHVLTGGTRNQEKARLYSPHNYYI